LEGGFPKGTFRSSTSSRTCRWWTCKEKCSRSKSVWGA